MATRFLQACKPPLSDLLQQEKKKRRNKRSPSYVALGSNDRYYIRFTDGSSQWSGNDDGFTEKVRGGASKGGIKSIAFGMPDSRGSSCMAMVDGVT